MRKTKIICTIGPACDSEETLEKMCRSGMNVARLNFSHGTHEEHLVRIQRLKKVREKLNLPIAIMLDTKGPEYRIKTFKEGKVTLKEGDSFTFTTNEVVGDQNHVSVSYKELMKDLVPGDTILVNNGLLSFKVRNVTATDAICTVEDGGDLSDRKSMSFPGKVISQKYLSDQDKDDLRFGIEQDVDFIACSFVSRRQDLLDLKQFLQENHAGNIELIAKIENSSGIENIGEICQECSGIMIGRGDMGVEIPFERLPSIQKKLITKCRMLGKRVITATEMLESMITNPRPTRAETSDVANAIYDGTSAIMLSGETAAGKYPVLALQTMVKIADQTEKDIDYEKWFRTFNFEIKNTLDAISHAVCGMSIDIHAKAIVVCSISGMTVRMVSRFRSPVDIVGVTTNEKSRRHLALSWGVTPVMSPVYDSIDVMFFNAKEQAEKALGLQDGDNIILTGGMINGASGNTNLIKVETMRKR